MSQEQAEDCLWRWRSAGPGVGENERIGLIEDIQSFRGGHGELSRMLQLDGRRELGGAAVRSYLYLILSHRSRVPCILKF
jgi:hypothetical protein